MSHDKSYNKICRICGKKRKWKMLNKLFVSGTINRGFFRKSKDFELVIYFSGLKKLIFEVYSDDINLKDPKLGIDFGVGDNLDKSKEWIKKNGYVIGEIDRFNY
jgi:hypothetical protein